MVSERTSVDLYQGIDRHTPMSISHICHPKHSDGDTLLTATVHGGVDESAPTGTHLAKTAKRTGHGWMDPSEGVQWSEDVFDLGSKRSPCAPKVIVCGMTRASLTSVSCRGRTRMPAWMVYDHTITTKTSSKNDTTVSAPTRFSPHDTIQPQRSRSINVP